jgi:hypothetical protein
MAILVHLFMAARWYKPRPPLASFLMALLAALLTTALVPALQRLSNGSLTALQRLS